MKKTILSIALAIVAPFAWGQTSSTTTTTTTTDGGGTITEYTPGSVITLKETSGPRHYKFGKKVVYVTKSGKELDETTVKETPDLSFNGTSAFASVVNQNAAAIIAEVPGGDSHTIPLQFGGQPFMAGSVLNRQQPWNGPGISNPDARFHASLNTCNGCHGPETGTFNFLMVNPRFPGSEAQLSPFITGTSQQDPFTGQTRTINDLGRRKTDLTGLVCAPAPAAVAIAKK